MPDIHYGDNWWLVELTVRFSGHFYRPQTKFAKVMFLQVSVCPQGRGACVVGGGWGCVVGGMHSWGHAWLLGGHT